MANEIFALHLDGKLLSRKLWGEYSDKYNLNMLGFFRTSKKFYSKRSYAKRALEWFPSEFRNRIQVVRYTPEEERS